MQYSKMPTVDATKNAKATVKDKTVVSNVPAVAPADGVKFAGETVDMNYAVVPEEKDAILSNLKKAGEDTLKRFGLDEKGVEPETYPGQ